MIIQALKDWGQVAAYVVGIGAAALSYRQYRKNSARQRTLWIYDLYRRLWDQPSLRSMRLRIDNGDLPSLDALDATQLADFDDYLNFFEFIGYLRQSKELRQGEIETMFDYSMKQIAEIDGISSYLAKYGYEQTSALLLEMGYSH